jgi:histidinol-phosphate aminotransferase
MKINFRALANSGVRNLIPYQPGKPVEELERELGIVSSLKLASNENPLGASPKAIAAAEEALLHAHIYPDGNCFELKQQLAQFLAVEPEQLTLGNGSENVLELIVKAYLQQEDTAVISQYAFLTIPLLIACYGASIKVAPANKWGHDIPEMLNAMDDKTRVLFLVNPNNPTGTYINEKDFRMLMESVPPHVLVIIDEAYFEYRQGADYPNTMESLSRYPNMVIVRTFSKIYGLAALRLGYAISSIEIADMLNRARLPFNVNTIAAKAGCAALEDQEHVKASILLNQQGMQQVESRLLEWGINYIPSMGNFITFEVNDAAEVYQKLLYEGVIVRPLNAYEMPNHIRVTIGTHEQNERFLNALQKILFRVTSPSEAISDSLLND